MVVKGGFRFNGALQTGDDASMNIEELAEQLAALDVPADIYSLHGGIDAYA